MKFRLKDVSKSGGGVVIHFGMPKTGSTSIQASLYKGLKDNRYYYVDFGRANPNQYIISGFPDNPRRFRLHQKMGLSDDKLMALRDYSRNKLDSELSRASDKTAIISSEAIYGLQHNELSELLGAVNKHSDRVFAVGYVRRPKEYMESVFQQNLKFDDVISLNVNNLFPAYIQKLRKFDDLLGKENVKFWVFDPATFPEKCVVKDFCSKLGIRVDKVRILRSNDGLSLPAASLLFTYRKYGPGYGDGERALKENRALVSYISQLSGPKLRFHSSLVAPVIDKHKAEVSWVSKRVGVPFGEDVAAHDEEAVRSESDLLDLSSETLSWIRDQVSRKEVGKPHPGMNMNEYVATCMHALRSRLAKDLTN